jgi:hypothetical protein
VKQPHHEVQFCVWSYDHALRDDREWDRIKRCIENHPVKAGLVANAEDYLLSSGGKKGRDESRPSRLDSLRHG